MKYDVIIVGAGPAGLFSAISLRNQNKSVLVLEKNNMAGKKLLLSGAGQCNITHGGDMSHYANHYGDHYKYIKNALECFTNRDTVTFFEKQGLKMEQVENGKVFPKTRQASDLVEVLLKMCKKQGVHISYHSPVKEIQLLNDTYSVMTQKETYQSEFVIIATGGSSYPKTGSTGDGYTLAAALGHKIIPPRPALTPVEIQDFPFTALSGISFESLPISIWRNGKKEKDCIGDLLFTHKGLSGPGILNSSRWMKEGDILYVNFIKDHNITSFNKKLLSSINQSGADMIKTVLRKYNLPKRLLDALLSHIGIHEETQCAQINKQTRNLIVQSLIAFPFIISKMGGFHVAMVTAGGIDLKKINPTTMESRICKNLYFIGEVLDIDGDTGGYNLQAALSTGMLCATGINRKETK
ncbi:MAG TPA: NAD(P)/FAD-dependent oxidoreductase [Epulopiscium sp.]|nr:NAD(P)/FAD-dependent oxidoreductase [Candidatus Epulonipiscium sp.]